MTSIIKFTNVLRRCHICCRGSAKGSKSEAEGDQEDRRGMHLHETHTYMHMRTYIHGVKRSQGSNERDDMITDPLHAHTLRMLEA